ncbi:hypothetical protein [Streptomyces shenzhenensis]|uniref:hypothetical protein n=1 Tax=Streptomyces shenzhenensis TaxID=943815 RepID=UPI00368EBDEB
MTADDAESVAFRRAVTLAEMPRLAHFTDAQVTRRQGSALFEGSGTRSALDSRNPHRLRRDARTPTPHDPARWKVQHNGRQVRGGSRPPRHGLL